jgi:hypothetical protein
MAERCRDDDRPALLFVGDLTAHKCSSRAPAKADDGTERLCQFRRGGRGSLGPMI